MQKKSNVAEPTTKLQKIFLFLAFFLGKMAKKSTIRRKKEEDSSPTATCKPSDYFWKPASSNKSLKKGRFPRLALPLAFGRRYSRSEMLK